MKPSSRPKQEANRTLSSMPATDKKTRPKVKQVSSRYLTSPSISPSPTPAPSSSSSPFNNTHFRNDSFNPEKDHFVDENSVGVPSKAVESSQRRKQVRLFTDDAIEEEHQSRKVMPLSRNPLKSMNLGIGGSDRFGEHPDVHLLLRNFSKCSMDLGSKRKETGDSLFRASANYFQNSMRLASSQEIPLEQDKEIGRPFNLLKPPQHPNGKLEMKLSKESKASKRQEDAHLLRLLENRYLQWRFVNAKAQVADCARRTAAEKSLHNVLCEILGLQDSVMMKRIEFEQLRRAKRLVTTLETQMPHLDEWTILEGDYSSSLSGATKTLQDALSRLPISESVNADISELKVVIDSALIAMEGSACVEMFLTKAQGMESIILELMKIVSTEKILIGECGDLLSVVDELRVKECSLRSQLVQIKRRSVK